MAKEAYEALRTDDTEHEPFDAIESPDSDLSPSTGRRWVHFTRLITVCACVTLVLGALVISWNMHTTGKPFAFGVKKQGAGLLIW